MAILAAAVLGIAGRAIYTTSALEDLRKAEATRQQLQDEAVKAERVRLTGEIRTVEVDIQSARATGEQQMREARATKAVAATRYDAAQKELADYIKEHRLERWLPGSAVSKQIVKLEEAAEGFACTKSRSSLAERAANAGMNRQVGALNERKKGIERELAALAPLRSEVVLPTWWDAFFGRWEPSTKSVPPISDPPPPIPSAVPQRFTYGLPDIHPDPAPVRKTTLFELLDIRSASELIKWLRTLEKHLQDEVVRFLKDKPDGSLVDLTVGCKTVTMNKPVAEALWTKYQYFLAQTDFQCEIAPTSDFREYRKQWLLLQEKTKSGPPVASGLNSWHLVGDAVDQSVRCQSDRLPFDFDQAGRVIFVRVDSRGQAVHEPVVREAIIARRKAEFAEDYKRLVDARGDVGAWEAAQYEVALHELMRFPSGTGIYGAHVMSFEAGLKAGLVGAFCGIPHDPIHSQLSIGSSRAECGGKMNGKPACYRVDGTGKPDCWRESPRWNEMVDAERKRSWGRQYAQWYGPARLDRYMPKVGSQAAVQVQ